KKPLLITQERGSLKMEGGIGLDGKLDLPGVLSLSPETVKTITKGKVTLREPLPMGFKLGGLAWQPEVTGVDFRPAVQVILQQASKGGLSTLLGGKLGERAKELGLGGSPPAQSDQAPPDQAQQDSEKRRQEEIRRLQDKAKQGIRGLFK